MTRRIKGVSKTGRNFACNTRSRTKVKIKVPTHTPSRGPTPQHPVSPPASAPCHSPDLFPPTSAQAEHHAPRLERNIFIMAIDSEEFLHLARPVAPAAPGFNTNISPMTVNIQPQVSFLSHLNATSGRCCPGSDLSSPPLSRQSSPSSTMPSAATTLPQKTPRQTHPSPASLAP